MAETSRSRVTITLGRSGQVVKRSLDSAYVPAPAQPPVGSKRPVRERLGANADSNHSNSKRQRGDSNRLSTSAANGVEDMRLGRNDLRFRIMQKNVLKQTQNDGHQNGVDLRDLLSRPSRPSTSSMQQHIPEQGNSRHHMPEPKDNRQRLPESKDIRQRLPEPKDVYRQRMPEPKDVRQYMPEPPSSSLLGRNPSLRTADDLPPIPSLRDTYSPWTMERVRRRSPDRVLGASRGLSPPRNDEDLQRRAVIRTYDDGRTVQYMSKDVKLSRPMGATSYMTKSSLPAGPATAAPPLVDEQHTVEGLLHALGLEKYSIHFKAEEVDMTALRQMGDTDLKELGIPMGPRKKILLALLARSKRRQV